MSVRMNFRKTGRYLHRLVDDPGFLQQVLGYLRSGHRPAVGELHLQVFAEAAGVVIDDSAGVSKSLHQTVDQQDFLLECMVVGLYKTLFQVRMEENDRKGHNKSLGTKRMEDRDESLQIQKNPS